MEDFIAYPSARRISRLVLLSALFIAVGLWMTGVFGPQPTSHRFSPAMLTLIGWLAVCGFSLTTFVLLGQLLKGAELVRIGSAGVRVAAWSDRTIPWAEIQGVKIWQHRRQKMMILRLRDPALFPPTGLAAFSVRLNRGLTGGHIWISFAAADCTVEEGFSAIQRFLPEIQAASENRKRPFVPSEQMRVFGRARDLAQGGRGKIPVCFLVSNRPLAPDFASKQIRVGSKAEEEIFEAAVPNGSMDITAGGFKFTVMAINAPAPDFTDEEDIGQKLVWPERAFQKQCWKSHVIVSAGRVSMSPGDLCRASEAVLQFAARIAKAPEIQAVGWGHSNLFMGAAQFLARVENKSLPPELLVRCHWLGDARSRVVETQGLGGLGLPEIRHRFAVDEVGGVYDLVMNLADYLILKGDIIAPGDTIENGSAGTRGIDRETDAAGQSWLTVSGA